MSATEDDTELRDLLLHNLDNSGVLNKIKAEMRAAVFLALEEQDRVENKTSLVNENLKKCLSTRDGRLVASLIVDFLQVFNLDFSLAVFQPEINLMNGVDSRDLVCRDLDLSECEVNRKCPLLLELVNRGRRRDKHSVCLEEPSHKQITNARRKFDLYDKERSGSVCKEDLKSIFADLFPNLNKNMLETFVTDELRAADRSHSQMADFQLFLGIFKRLFAQCRIVVGQDSDVGLVAETATTSPHICKDSDVVMSLGKGDIQQEVSFLGFQSERVDLEVEDDLDEGDSFFDDPLPKPQKTYGWKLEASGARESPAGAPSDAPRPGGGNSAEQSNSRNGKSKGFRDSKASNDKTGSFHFDEDVEYDDDFNSHRSDLSRSELSIGEEIEEVSIEGPDSSDKLDETQDLSVSQLSHSADYMEEVA
ncbi:FGFR1 oncogene partner isoform X2 [Hippoglossus hippoglossus]|uniref:FGFR1 oncogene partner isoform X2 n=1 Tax=Hippoglossus hippoglossus TaxID=8267 RepID=UPI00148B913D|nr:FGFR1 oncogene partner isoform X2 [Hippoglossus hippoglossus]